MQTRPVGQQYFAVVQSSLAKAGITVKPGAIPRGDYYKVVFDPKNELTGEFGNTGWGPDWPNAFTVIEPAVHGCRWLGPLEGPTIRRSRPRSRTQPRPLIGPQQAAKWQALNKQAVQQGWIIPTFFGYAQNLAGTKVGPIYRWPGASSWPYSVMGVAPVRLKPT